MINISEEDLINLLDPKVANRIKAITKKIRDNLKDTKGFGCQGKNHKHKTEKDVLESAHKIKDRKEYIKDVVNKKQGQLNIKVIVDEIIQNHYPLEDHFIFLCPDCHRLLTKEEKEAKKRKRK